MSESNHITAEEFREISDWLGYRVSDFGRVQSRRQSGGDHLREEWRDLAFATSRRSGHRFVCLSVNGRHRNVFVHRLVLEAFVGPCPSGYQACHYDGDPANNHLSNLRWDTAAANAADRRRHGHDRLGERNNKAKLQPSDIPKVFLHHRRGLNCKEIGRIFGVSGRQIGNILTRKSWAHIPVDRIA